MAKGSGDSQFIKSGGEKGKGAPIKAPLAKSLGTHKSGAKGSFPQVRGCKKEQ